MRENMKKKTEKKGYLPLVSGCLALLLVSCVSEPVVIMSSSITTAQRGESRTTVYEPREEQKPTEESQANGANSENPGENAENLEETQENSLVNPEYQDFSQQWEDFLLELDNVNKAISPSDLSPENAQTFSEMATILGSLQAMTAPEGLKPTFDKMAKSAQDVGECYAQLGDLLVNSGDAVDIMRLSTKAKADTAVFYEDVLGFIGALVDRE